ncbi:MAG: hypothetical protein JRI32_10875 [Deltaproteobacteria bacterium]|nr:hypothetical protein [Deltaproteobacteria bacterium]
MENLKNLFRKPEFHFFLFCISLVLFGWPILRIAEGGYNYSVFIYLFIAWAIIIQKSQTKAGKRKKTRWRMFNPLTVIIVFFLYAVFLFLIAMWAERKTIRGKSPADNPVVYSLSLAVYCTAWMYYGSVGKAATSGMLFLAIYLGPTIAIILGWTVLRKLVRIKNAHRITSIADFISALLPLWAPCLILLFN